MFIKKASFVLFTTVAFSLMACDGSSSDALNDSLKYENDECEFSSKSNSFTMDYGFYSIKVTNGDGYLKTVVDYSGYGSKASLVMDEACEEEKSKESEKYDVSCKGKTITTYDYEEDYTDSDFKSYVKMAKSICEDNLDFSDLNDEDEEDEEDDDIKKPSKEKKDTSETVSNDDDDGDEDENYKDDDDGDEDENYKDDDDEKKDDEDEDDNKNPSKVDKDSTDNPIEIDLEKEAECTGDNDGEVFIDDSFKISHCKDGKLVKGQPECNKKNEGMKLNVYGVASVCKNGEWVTDYGLPECTSKLEGSTQDASFSIEGMDITTTMMCLNGVWEQDFDCTEEREGMVKNYEVWGMNLGEKCVDGKWESISDF